MTGRRGATPRPMSSPRASLQARTAHRHPKLAFLRNHRFENLAEAVNRAEASDPSEVARGTRGVRGHLREVRTAARESALPAPDGFDGSHRPPPSSPSSRPTPTSRAARWPRLRSRRATCCLLGYEMASGCRSRGVDSDLVFGALSSAISGVSPTTAPDRPPIPRRARARRRRRAARATDVPLKVDTGMNRLAFNTNYAYATLVLRAPPPSRRLHALRHGREPDVLGFSTNSVPVRAFCAASGDGPAGLCGTPPTRPPFSWIPHV